MFFHPHIFSKNTNNNTRTTLSNGFIFCKFKPINVIKTSTKKTYLSSPEKSPNTIGPKFTCTKKDKTDKI